jgi:t-SNARE complex subunit (syntaxin)
MKKSNNNEGYELEETFFGRIFRLLKEKNAWVVIIAVIVIAVVAVTVFKVGPKEVIEWITDLF